MSESVAVDRPTGLLSAGLTGLALRIEQFIASGGRAVVLVGPPGVGKMRLADAALSGLPGRQTRITNRTPGPLSMKRVLRQVGAPFNSGAGRLFFGIMAEQAYDDQPASVVVEDAHTLTPYALSMLCRVPGLGGPEHPGMLLWLVGEPPLLAKLSAPGLELLRNPRRTMVLTMPRNAAAATSGTARLIWTAMSTDDRSDSSPASSPAGVAAEAVRARVAEMPIRRAADTAAQQPPAPNRAAAPRAGRLLLAGAMGVAVTLGWMAWPESSPSRPQAAASVAQDDVMAAPAEQPEMSPDPARDAAAVKTLIEPAGTKEPARAELTAPALGPPPTVNAAPPPDLAAPTPEPTPAQIKREFDAFLNRAGRDTAKLTPASREALFREYLQWRIRASLAGP